jgi:hypothetical protein
MDFLTVSTLTFSVLYVRISVNLNSCFGFI